MELTEGEYLAHYGILRKSGRYPWGSGKNPLQRSKTFLDILDAHRKAGLTEAQIADLYQPKDENGKKIPPYFTVADLRAVKSRAVTMRKQDEIRTAQTLADKGMSPSAIARQMSTPEKRYNESTIRSYLAPGRQEKLDITQSTAEMLKRQVAEKGIIDIGAHVERDLPIGDNPEVRINLSRDKLNTALSLLKEEGYAVTTFKIPQVGTGELTTRRVLLKPSKPNMTPEAIQREAFLNRENVQLISEKTQDGGHSWEDTSFKPPLSISSKRVAIRYKEDGGADADGVIYVRPGVKDVTLGKSQYAQVRIAVDGTHYLKGMAVYKNDLPKGVDLMFNTNKSDTGSKHDAMKPLKTDKNGDVDWKNPFGSFPKPGGQILGADKKPTSVMNILHEEGDWSTWSRTLSAQMLSKQSPELAKSQLDLTYERRQNEFEKIKALTNPLIKRKLLETFGDETDAAAVNLKAAALPRQATSVILPLHTIKPDEIYAPNFKNGERVALVRFPHAGTFEIPELTVNNRNREAREMFSVGKGGKPPIDAVGIHPKVAERLSGADFDGDHVVVIPNNRGTIENSRPLDGLKGFDPQKYKVPLGPPTPEHPNGTPIISPSRKGDEMGRVTNLISDMTIRGATADELAQAVRHSMVVIDSEKHNLDFKASERDNNILALKKKYQGRINPDTGRLNTGASTLITRATADIRVPKRKAAPAGPGRTRISNATIDNATGEKLFVPTGETDKHGNIKRFRSRRLAETTDAFTLVSEGPGTRIEKVYAAHSNRLKELANEARKELVNTPTLKKSPSAAVVYEKEVQSLNAKLNKALKNAPRERQAQALAQSIISQRRKANPQMDESQLKKIKGQALEEARLRTGAKKDRIDITDAEWQAIQQRAISNDKLEKILQNTDVDKLRERATPRDKPVMTPAAMSRAKTMLASGYTYDEIATALSIPASTLKSGLKDGG